MWLCWEFHGPRWRRRVRTDNVLLEVVVVAYAVLMIDRNSDKSFFGGVGISGHMRLDRACHAPENRLPGILAPVASARSAIVMTLRYSRT